MSPPVVVVLLSLVATSLAAGLPYIIGGDEVTFIDFYPWQGSVHTELGQYLCGCSLLSSEWAVTAASCALSPQRIVRFGSTNRSEGTLRPVLEVKVHEYYSTNGATYRYNDVAVMRFAPLTLSDKIKPIKMGETEEASNKNCYITGWGLLNSEDTNHPEALRQGKVTVVANTVCDDKWGSTINSSHVCTHYSASPVTCGGDEGSPLVCYKGDHYELVGINSWHRSGCATNYFPVYSRVSYFKEWILAHAHTRRTVKIHG